MATSDVLTSIYRFKIFVLVFGFQGTIVKRCAFYFVRTPSSLAFFSPSRHFYERQIYRSVGLSGLEPPTSRLSGVRSNRLSYKPRLLSKCADIWGYARGACTPEHKSLWMHMRRSRGMTGRRPGIPALANFKCWRSRPMTNRRFGIPTLTNCKCWRIRLLLVLS